MDDYESEYDKGNNLMGKEGGSVKKRIENLEKGIAEIRASCVENRKQNDSLRNELNNIDNKAIEKFNQLTKLIKEDLDNLNNELTRTKSSDNNENKFIAQQISSLQKDKNKLTELFNQVDQKLRVCENEIGMNDY